MNYAFLQSLLTQAEAFERDTPVADQQTLPRFAAWLGQQSAPPTANDAPASQPDEPNRHALLNDADAPDTQIGVMVSYLYRYNKLYGKKILADTPLTTIDEFSYLIMLLDAPDAPTKTELIERNIHEKTTGIEILRRLIKGGLVEQIDDPTDRRAKRLKLTEKGMGVLSQVIPRLAQLVKLLSGNLTMTEKTQLVSLLTKLHLFHNQLFHHERNTPVETLVERMTATNK
jgi:MarR family transcriptional regulator, lower aerobic nicotinate degradation pathway regulator